MAFPLPSNPVVRGMAVFYTTTFLSAAWSMIIPTIPVLAQYFGVTAGGAAQIVTVFAIGKFIGTIIGGVVIDRMGTRTALVGGPLVGGIASLLAVGAPAFNVILLLALVMGAADSLWASAREVGVIDLARHNQRGRMLSSIHGTYNIGTAVFPLIGGSLTDLLSFRAVFVSYGVSALLSVFLGFAGPNSVAISLARGNPDRATRLGLAALQRRLKSFVGLFKEIRPDLRSTYLALVLATLVNQSQRIIIQSMLPLYAGYYLHLSPTQIGLLFSISGVVVFAMIIPAGFVMDRIGRKWCTVPSTALPALAFVLIPITNNFTELAILVGFAAIAQGLALGSVATSTYDVVPAHVRGRLQAARRTVAELGSGLAPLLGGYLANTFNPGVPFLVYAPLLVFSATLLAVVGKETLGQPGTR
jgi:MFS transporter, ACDE family, multidrug resistance protein